MSSLRHDFAAPVAAALSAPEVSVVMPVFNAEATLAAAVRSVLAQDFGDFELIAVDDGSRDDSLSVLLDLAAGDMRIHVVSRANGGVSSARNLGGELARGELIAFLDADDLWAPDKLSRHVALHRAEPALAASYARIAFIAGDAAGLDGARTHSQLCPHPPGLRDVLGENPVCTTSNFVMRRDWFERLAGFDASLGFAEDQELVARLIARDGTLAGIDALLTGYRFSPLGLSMDGAAMYAGWRAVAGRYLPARDRAPLEALYCRYLARRVLRGGGRPGVALHYVLAGLRLNTPAFLRDRRRGLATIAGALLAPLLPPAWRLRLFA